MNLSMKSPVAWVSVILLFAINQLPISVFGSDKHSPQIEPGQIRVVDENAIPKTKVGRPLSISGEFRGLRLLTLDAPFLIDQGGQLIVNGSLDFEMKARYELECVALHPHGNSEPTVVTVLVENVPEKSAILVSRSSGLITSEDGREEKIRVSLTGDHAPEKEVYITLTASDPSEAELSVNRLVFDAQDWRTPKEFKVMGLNDIQYDGHINYAVRLRGSLSEDPRFDGLPGHRLTFTNLDNDLVHVESDGALVTSEDGSTATFRVFLETQPWSDVSIQVLSHDPGEATVSPNRLVFTRENWDRPQTVTVNGRDDDLADGVSIIQVSIGQIESLDKQFAGIDPDDLQVINLDNETGPLSIVQFVSPRHEVFSQGGSRHEILLQRSGSLRDGQTITYQVTGTAALHHDFLLQPAPGEPITFQPGQKHQVITFRTPPDREPERMRAVHLTLAANSPLPGQTSTTVFLHGRESGNQDDYPTHRINVIQGQRNRISLRLRGHRENLLEAGYVEDDEPLAVKPIGLPDGARIRYDQSVNQDILIWRPTRKQLGVHRFQVKLTYLNDPEEMVQMYVEVLEKQ